VKDEEITEDNSSGQTAFTSELSMIMTGDVNTNASNILTGSCSCVMDCCINSCVPGSYMAV
jgi:hypothetical protein